MKPQRLKGSCSTTFTASTPHSPSLPSTLHRRLSPPQTALHSHADQLLLPRRPPPPSPSPTVSFLPRRPPPPFSHADRLLPPVKFYVYKSVHVFIIDLLVYLQIYWNIYKSVHAFNKYKSVYINLYIYKSVYKSIGIFINLSMPSLQIYWYISKSVHAFNIYKSVYLLIYWYIYGRLLMRGGFGFCCIYAERVWVLLRYRTACDCVQ